MAKTSPQSARALLPRAIIKLRSLVNPKTHNNWFDETNDITLWLESYYKSHRAPRRLVLLEEIRALLPTLSRPVKMIEFGAFAGPNLRLIQEELGESHPLSLYATDPNQQAVDFMRKKMPYVEGTRFDSHSFCESLQYHSAGLQVGIISFVLTYLTEPDAKAVVIKMAGICEHLFLYEVLANHWGNKSILSHPDKKSVKHYFHPYRNLLRESGWNIHKIIYDSEATSPEGGWIVAHRKSR